MMTVVMLINLLLLSSSCHHHHHHNNHRLFALMKLLASSESLFASCFPLLLTGRPLGEPPLTPADGVSLSTFFGVGVCRLFFLLCVVGVFVCVGVYVYMTTHANTLIQTHQNKRNTCQNTHIQNTHTHTHTNQQTSTHLCRAMDADKSRNGFCACLRAILADTSACLFFHHAIVLDVYT